MKVQRKFATTFIILFLLFFALQPSYGIDNREVDQNVYVIVINKLTLSDIKKMPNIMDMLEYSSLGLMNTRGLSSYSGAESFATINASDKAYASNQSSLFHNLDSNFKKIYENRVGPLDKEYAIGNIEVGRLYSLNDDNNYSPNIGALGDVLHNNGLETAVYGNSDTDEDLIRTAALIPMDSKGLVDYGNVDNVLVEDSNYPYGLKTDYNKILKEVSDIKDKASLIVIDTGDLMRLNSYSTVLSDESFNEKRDMILNDINIFIGDLLNSVNREQSLFIISSPNRVAERIDNSRLSPIILSGDGINKGITTSTTTNRIGIISNLDIVPTIADFFDISLAPGSGSIIKSVEDENPLDNIISINSRTNITSRVRSKTLTAYGLISIIVMLVISLAFLLKIKINLKMQRAFKVSLLVIYGLPLIFIVISLFNIDTLFKFIIYLILGTIIYTLIVVKYNSKRALHNITFLYFAIIIIDILFGGIITKYSVLSHDPIIGARYFGIGNESAGLFLAISMLGLGILYSRFKNKPLIIIILLSLIVLVGHPNLGANVGGMIAFVIASLFFGFEIFNKKLDIKNIIIIAIAVIIAISVFGYIDVNLNPNPTHLGKALISINNQGSYIAENIIKRKLLMNVKLVGTSFWTKVLLVNIFVHVIVSYFHKKKLSNFLNNELKIGYLACIVGSIIGLLVNDSGIILAAIAINMITIFLLFNIIDYKLTYNK